MSFGHRDLSAVAAMLRDAGRAEIMPRFRRLAADAVRTKSGPLDFVTEADEAAEAMIAAALHRAFPGCVVVGEEAATADPSILAGLADAELAFVVDPVDGTANFTAGLALFGVMAAAISRGEVIAIRDGRGLEVARGLANYAAAEARLLCKKPSSEFQTLLGYTGEPEMVHRDNLILMLR